MISFVNSRPGSPVLSNNDNLRVYIKLLFREHEVYKSAEPSVNYTNALLHLNVEYLFLKVYRVVYANWHVSCHCVIVWSMYVKINVCRAVEVIIVICVRVCVYSGSLVWFLLGQCKF